MDCIDLAKANYMIEDIKFTLTLVASLGALIFSFMNYRRDKRYANENFLYNLKVEAYFKIIKAYLGLLNKLEEIYDEVGIYLENCDEVSLVALHELADRVDDLTFSFSDLIIENSLVLPKNVISGLQKLNDSFYKIPNVVADNNPLPEHFKILRKEIDELYTSGDKIDELFRIDLHIDTLNSSLYKRLKR